MIAYILPLSIQSMAHFPQHRFLDKDLQSIIKAGEEFDVNRIPFVLEACKLKYQKRKKLESGISNSLLVALAGTWKDHGDLCGYPPGSFQKCFTKECGGSILGLGGGTSCWPNAIQLGALVVPQIQFGFLSFETVFQRFCDVDDGED